MNGSKTAPERALKNAFPIHRDIGTNSRRQARAARLGNVRCLLTNTIRIDAQCCASPPMCACVSLFCAKVVFACWHLCAFLAPSLTLFQRDVPLYGLAAPLYVCVHPTTDHSPQSRCRPPYLTLYPARPRPWQTQEQDLYHQCPLYQQQNTATTPRLP